MITIKKLYDNGDYSIYETGDLDSITQIVQEGLLDEKCVEILIVKEDN